MSRRLSESFAVLLSVVVPLALSIAGGGVWIASHLSHTVALTVMCDSDMPTTVEVDGTQYTVVCPGEGIYGLTVQNSLAGRTVSVG